MNRTLMAMALGASLLATQMAGAGELVASSGAAVPGEYIVTFDHAPGAQMENVDPAVRKLLDSKRIGILNIWDATHAIHVAIPNRKEAEALSKLPGVLVVEPNYAGKKSSTQTNAPVALDLTDQRTRTPNSTYVYNYTGSNVTAYVLDQGVRTTNVDFGGRASFLKDIVTPVGQPEVRDESPCDGNHGHGTAVASVLGGTRFGVAKQVKIKSIRMLTPAGVNSAQMVAALNAAITDVQTNHTLPAVLNIASDVGTASVSVDNAIQAAVDAGIFVAVAAGNDGNNTCMRSPPRAPSAFTVGYGSMKSNNGPCVDMFASGNNVVAAGCDADNGVLIGDTEGSSFASPFTAGAAALVLSQFPNLTPNQVGWELIARSTKNLLVDGTDVSLAGAPNRWLYTLPLSYTTVPSVPSVLQRDTCSAGHYSAYWQPGVVNASNLSTYFELQRSTSSAFSSVASTYVDGSFTNGFEDFASGTPLYFRVRACNSRGCSAFKSSTPAGCG